MLVVIMCSYVALAVSFVFVTGKCFGKKLSIPKILVLLAISPSVGGLASFLFSLGLNQEVMDFDEKVMLVFGLQNMGLQLAVQAFFLWIYVKIIKAKNTSIAVFVYMCSTLIVPGFFDLVEISYAAIIPCYIVLHLMFYFLVIKRLSKFAAVHQVTDKKLFAILPVSTYIFNTILYCIHLCIYSSTNIDDDMKDALIMIMRSEGDETLEKIRPAAKMILKTLRYEKSVLFISRVFIAAVVIVAFYVIVRNIQYMNETIKAKEEIKNLSVEVMEALAHTIDAKDEYTRGHSIRVAKYSRMIAEKMGMTAGQCEDIYYMGLLHDIGKIGVPNEIINKPDRLTDDEYDEIKKHPGMGFDILAEIKTRPDLATGARWHHERYDGTGYPDHKKGDEIPVEARIIAVADSYDAMTSNRSYRKYLPQQKVREELEKNIGTQFDETPARTMLEIIDEDKEYMLHE